MSQISPPIRILLVCAIGFLGAYMLFLRPKDEVVPPAEPAPNVQTSEPAVSQPGKIAEAAQGAVEAANGQLAQQEGVDGVDAGEAAAGTETAGKDAARNAEAAAAVAGVDLKAVPKPIAKAIRKHKVLVLLFWNGKSADDKAVHKALAKVDRWDGRVYVGSASIKKISKYGAIARGVDVEQSPTVVVADAELRAETLVGYVDTLTIDQAVVDALRSTGPLFTDAYLRKVDAVCRDYRSTFNSIPNTFTTSPRKLAGAIKRVSVVYPRFADAFAAIKAPAKWRSFRTAIVANNTAAVAYYSDLAAYLGTNPSRARVLAGAQRFESRRSAINKGFRPRMRRARLTFCLS